MLDFAVIGAQKSGTNTLRLALARHPEVHLPLDEDPILQSEPYSHSGSAEHFRRVRRQAGGRAVGLKCATYLSDPLVPERLHEIAPYCRLVAVIRDPIERAVSAYAHYASNGEAPDVPVDQGLRWILDGRCERAYPRSHEVLSFGLTGQGLQTWISVFGRAQLLVLRTQDLERSPGRMGALIEHHLGLASPVGLAEIGRTNIGVYTPGRRLLLRLGRVLEGRSGGVASTQARRVTRSLDARLVQRVSARRPPSVQDQQLLDELRDYYRADQDLLSTLLAHEAK